MRVKSFKRAVNIIIAVIFAIALAGSIALSEPTSWDCPECGRTGNTGSFCGNCGQPVPTVTPLPTPEVTLPPMVIQPTEKPVRAGEIISFGRFEQDNNTDNGTETIEWIVLDVNEKDNKALLLSRYGLCSRQYNTRLTDVTWEKCTLRSWLNEEFLKSVFSKPEQAAILMTEVDNGPLQGYSGWKTKGGNDTKDKLFLLSYAEANRYLGVTVSSDTNTEARVAPTAYAIAQGASKAEAYKTADGHAGGEWWLRSPGYYQHNASYVSCAGSFLYIAANYGYNAIVVRPALWIDLGSGIF